MKLDTSLIDGYDAMTPEQKIEALLNQDLDPAKAGYRTKEEFDRVMSENAEKKKLLKDLEKSKTGEKDELTKRIEQLEQANKALERTNLVASTTAQYIGMGYDKDLAKEAAEASADGDMAKLVEVQQKFLKAHDEQLKAESLKGMQGLQGGGSGGKDDDKDKTYVDIAKSIGAQANASQKAMNDVLSHYMIR